jgi:hypothetical protein
MVSPSSWSTCFDTVTGRSTRQRSGTRRYWAGIHAGSWPSENHGVSHTRLIGYDWGSALSWFRWMSAPQRFNRFAALATGHPSAYRSAPVRQKEMALHDSIDIRCQLACLLNFVGHGEDGLGESDPLREVSRLRQER